MRNSRLNFISILTMILVLSLLFSIIYIDFKIKASLIHIAKAKVQVSTAKKVSQVVNDEIVAHIEYKDIVIVHKDDKGRIVLIQPNTIMLNKIMSGTVIEVSKYLENLPNDKIQIPAGQLIGSRLLSGYGPMMSVKIIPSGEVYVEVLNKFEQAGINQTRHLIYFSIKNKLKVAVPFLNDFVEVTTIIPLAETIVVGEVPETYVDFQGSGEMLYPFMKSIK